MCWRIGFLFSIMSYTVDMTKTILANNYDSNELLKIVQSFKNLSEDESQLLIIHIVLFIGLSEYGENFRHIQESNKNYISSKIGHSIED